MLRLLLAAAPKIPVFTLSNYLATALTNSRCGGCRGCTARVGAGTVWERGGGPLPLQLPGHHVHRQHVGLVKHGKGAAAVGAVGRVVVATCRARRLLGLVARAWLLPLPATCPPLHLATLRPPMQHCPLLAGGAFDLPPSLAHSPCGCRRSRKRYKKRKLGEAAPGLLERGYSSVSEGGFRGGGGGSEGGWAAGGGGGQREKGADGVRPTYMQFAKLLNANTAPRLFEYLAEGA